MSNNKYAAFFAAYNTSVKRGNPLTREEQIYLFTSGRTESLKDLSVYELNELVRRLNSTAVASLAKQTCTSDKADRMRKAIISIFHQMDSKNAAAAAKAWAEKQGVDGNKKHFNHYTPQELYRLILRAEKALVDYQMGIRKGLKRMTK